jgi:hypothetical protein
MIVANATITPASAVAQALLTPGVKFRLGAIDAEGQRPGHPFCDREIRENREFLLC